MAEEGEKAEGTVGCEWAVGEGLGWFVKARYGQGWGGCAVTIEGAGDGWLTIGKLDGGRARDGEIDGSEWSLSSGDGDGAGEGDGGVAWSVPFR